MKNERQEKILAIIAASAIETQEQLIDSLRKEGISCTQATTSCCWWASMRGRPSSCCAVCR